MTPTDTARDVLTQDEAEARAARISNCAYELAIDITPKSESYRASALISFDLGGSGDTFLCYRGKTIHLLEVNGRRVTPDWNGYRLTLPAAVLAASNTVRVDYENDFDHSGDGFHQFIDPEDGAEYLYSNFEPYEAHRLFPCFDQPDIKATYALTVTAPAEWEVVANSPMLTSAPADNGRSRRNFTKTKPFSTYLFALIAGPYDAVRDEHNGIPLGLFCRKSMLKHLDADEVFTITRQGLDFYASFFDYGYPFLKYDQIFVPEFNAGAMENVGAVTHNEFMIFRDPPTDNQRRRRAEVILHEMAHMWFGDLVTMRWWNDLWLNESFATYMAYLSMTSATRFTAGWQDFNASIKNWAYRQDQLVTTHPIAGQVEDTDQTFLNFDGITYGKGASVLKQLVASIGIEGFRAGMRHYFQTHAFGNATLAQFLASLEAGSGQSLQAWSAAWLETPSLNTIAATWQADGDRLTALTLTQTAPPEYRTVRPHSLEVGLVRDEGGSLTVTALPAKLDGEQADVAEARGLPRPSMVFPNYNDHGYAKVALDPESLAFIRENLPLVDDTLLRQLLWSSLFSMVRDQQLSSFAFLELVESHLPSEPEIGLLDPVLGQALTALTRYVPEEWKQREARKLFAAVHSALKAATDAGARIIWARTLLGAAIHADDLAVCAAIADGRETIRDFTMDQDMRWALAAKYVAYGLPGAEARLQGEITRDATDRGQRAKLRADVSVPDAGVKAAAWGRFLGEGYGSLYLTVAAMGGFNWSDQRELLQPYVDKFFEVVPAVAKREEKEFIRDFFGSLFPAYRVERAIIERSERLLAEIGNENPVLTRMLREANDELERALKCREFAASNA